MQYRLKILSKSFFTKQSAGAFRSLQKLNVLNSYQWSSLGYGVSFFLVWIFFRYLLLWYTGKEDSSVHARTAPVELNKIIDVMII